MKNGLESNVSYYNLRFPATFSKSKGAFIYDEDGRRFIDFFAAAGSLNYGHNNDYIKGKVIDYLEGDNIVQGLDMDTTAKIEFYDYFKKNILEPYGLDSYKVELCGPTGTNAVEAALRLARKVTGRTGVFSMSGSFHGMTQGSLSVSSIAKSPTDYASFGAQTTFIPYTIPGISDYDPLKYIEYILEDDHSGIQAPAAFILETLQAEGGINLRSESFLTGLEKLLRSKGILLIIDDIQVGCFRTGTFFSFEPSGIKPDIIVMSKSISGFGLPMSILILSNDVDIWSPGEHSGTFRGSQLSFIGAKAGLEYAFENNISAKVESNSRIISEKLNQIASKLGNIPKVRGKGMIWGLDFSPYGRNGIAVACSEKCFAKGLIIEVCGSQDCVLKIMPPLSISEETLEEGLSIIEAAVLESV